MDSKETSGFPKLISVNSATLIKEERAKTQRYKNATYWADSCVIYWYSLEQSHKGG